MLKQAKLDPLLKSNYRAIALPYQFNKLFDYLILVRTTEYLETSDIQFAFKSG